MVVGSKLTVSAFDGTYGDVLAFLLLSFWLDMWNEMTKVKSQVMWYLWCKIDKDIFVGYGKKPASAQVVGRCGS